MTMCVLFISLLLIWFRDILYELASVGDLPLPQGSPCSSNKRERNSDSPISMGEDMSGKLPKKSLVGGERTVAGSKRVNGNKERDNKIHQPPQLKKQELSLVFQQRQQQELLADVMLPRQDLTLIRDPAVSPLQSQSQSQMDMSTLPVYSDELGRIPLVNHTTSSSSPSLSSSLRPPPPPLSSPVGYHQPISNYHQPGNPGGLWYSFEQGQTQMLGLEGFGIVGSGSEESSGVNGPGSGMGLGLGRGGITGQQPQQQSQVDEADFIFNQLAMGYPAVPPLSLYMVGSQSGLGASGSLQQQQTLNGMGMGMMGSQHHGGGAGGAGMHGIGSSTEGLTRGSVVDQQRHHHHHRQHEYLGSEAMSMWSSTPAGFE